MEVKIDLDIMAYPAGDLIDFEDATGLALIPELAKSADEEGNVSTALLSGPLLLGLAWIAKRREDKHFTWQMAREQFSVSDLLDAMGEAEEPPLAEPNRAQRRASVKSSGPSASSTAGHRKPSAA